MHLKTHGATELRLQLLPYRTDTSFRGIEDSWRTWGQRSKCRGMEDLMQWHVVQPARAFCITLCLLGWHSHHCGSCCISGIVESCGLLIPESCCPPVKVSCVSMSYDAWDCFPSTPEELPQPFPGPWMCKMWQSELFITSTFLSRRRINFLFLQMAVIGQPKRGLGWPSASCCLFKLASHSVRLAKPKAPAVSLGCPCLALHLVTRGTVAQGPCWNQCLTLTRRDAFLPNHASQLLWWQTKKMPALELPLRMSLHWPNIWLMGKTLGRGKAVLVVNRQNRMWCNSKFHTSKMI